MEGGGWACSNKPVGDASDTGSSEAPSMGVRAAFREYYARRRGSAGGCVPGWEHR